jgi:raffinose/stachyose/melibiose transport system permease protein
MTGRASTVGRNLVLIGFALLFLGPIYLIFVNALKGEADIEADPIGIPFGRLTLDNLIGEITNPAHDLIGSYALSAWITVVSVGLAIFLGSVLGYLLARSSGRLPILVYLLLLAGLLVPPQVTLLPLVKLLSAIGLMFTAPGLILVDVAGYIPLAVLLYAGFIRTLPIELEEASRVDGATQFQTYRKIVLPLLRPATITVAIILGLICLTDFVNPSVILGTGSNTITTAINQAIGRYSTNYTEVYSALWWVTIPMLAIFISLQSRLVDGLTAGALRG